MMIGAIGVVMAAGGAIADIKRKNQAPVVAIVDFQQVTRESKAGASIRRQVNEQHAIYQEEIKRLQDELKIERQYLQGIQTEQSPEDFKRRSEGYRRKAENLQKLLKERKRQLDQMYVNGMREIESELARILEAIANEREIDIILNTTRGQGVVIFAKPQTLISEEAKTRLDKRLPNISLPVPSIAHKTGEIPQLPGKAKE
tara:strand:+ start:280 stop:882 length:603 start_codon:yes stop_codon:yes gene_type:complete